MVTDVERERHAPTVWIVGESDDLIAAGFTVGTQAQEYLDAMKARTRALGFSDDCWWIEEYPLDPPIPCAST